MFLGLLARLAPLPSVSSFSLRSRLCAIVWSFSPLHLVVVHYHLPKPIQIVHVLKVPLHLFTSVRLLPARSRSDEELEEGSKNEEESADGECEVSTFRQRPQTGTSC